MADTLIDEEIEKKGSGMSPRGARAYARSLAPPKQPRKVSLFQRLLGRARITKAGGRVMADPLVELDEAIEKAGLKPRGGSAAAGKRMTRGAFGRTYGRTLMRMGGFGDKADKLLDREYRRKDAGEYLTNRAKRVRKSADPLEALDSAIEKARPLLARGKDGTRRGTIGGVKVSLGRSGKSNGGARLFRAGSKMTYLDKPYADGGNSGRNQQRRNIKSYLASLKSGK
jgi:hypothetical protein